MPIYLGSTKIDLNLGNVSINEAYLGSIKVYAKASGYDSYILRVKWDDTSKYDNLTFQGMIVNGNAAAVTSARYYNSSWQNASATDIEHATTGNDAFGCYCNKVEFTLDVAATPSSVSWHAGVYYAPEGAIIGELVGIKDNVETVIAYTTGTQTANATYSITT